MKNDMVISMFENIGKKIKTLAKAICYLGIAASIITATVLLIISSDMPWGGESLLVLGLVLLFAGPIISWFSSFFMYGFGDLIDNSQEIKEKLQNMNSNETNKNTEKNNHLINMRITRILPKTFVGECELCGKNSVVLRECVCRGNFGIANRNLCEKCISTHGKHIEQEEQKDFILSQKIISEEKNPETKQCLSCGRIVPVTQVLCKCGSGMFEENTIYRDIAFCPKCGADIKSDTTACHVCGEKI